MLNPDDRLRQFLVKRNRQSKIVPLTPDASTREYFRIDWKDETAIACVYPEAFIADEQNYIDVTELFLSVDLPVANILDFDEELAVIVIDDFGDNILRDRLAVLDVNEKDDLVDQAIGLIARIQAATENAFEKRSIASQLRFDTEKLLWELDFFKTHYFLTLKKKMLPEATITSLQDEFASLAGELDSLASVLCHRDFHAANLMIGKDGQLRIIDHQDARIGTTSYDLVSLLLDRVTEIPDSNWIDQRKVRFFEERVKIGFPQLDRRSFDREFELQTIQRCLKAAGTFSFQSANRGKTHFIKYIDPMFRIVVNAINKVGGYPVLLEVLSDEIENAN